MVTTNPERRDGRIGLVVGAFALLLAGSALYGAFRFWSVCTRCGAIRYTTKWQIPLTSVTLLRTSSEQQTPVSAELLRSGVVSKHEHQWMFSSGAGNRVTCALGKGRHIRPVVQSHGVASVLAAGQQFGEVPFRDRLVRLMFDTKTSEAVGRLGLRVPTNGFADATEFHTWLNREMEFFDELVTLYQER